MDQKGLYDYSEVTREISPSDKPMKIKVILSSRQKFMSILVGFLFGLAAIAVAVTMRYFLDFSLDYYMYAIPVLGLTHLIKRDGNITVFVFLGFLLGSYAVTYILGFLFLGFLLFV